MNLVMTQDEIFAMYRDAKHKAKQIDILAELNCCSAPDIARLLHEHGFDLPYKYRDCPSHVSRGSPEHQAKTLAKISAAPEAVSDPDTEAPEIKSASVSAGSPEPAPAEAAGLCVGDLIAQLQGLPDGIRVTVGGGPVTTVAFVREYSARTGETRTEVILS